jgi:hypothetical protein
MSVFENAGRGSLSVIIMPILHTHLPREPGIGGSSEATVPRDSLIPPQ